MKRFGLTVLIALTMVDCGGGDGGTGPTLGSITISAGNAQVGTAGAALAESLAVIVKDQAGAPLAGVTVAFTIPSGGGSVSPASRQTSAAGIAKTLRTLGPNAGTQTTNAIAGALPAAAFSSVAQISGAVNIANATTGPLTDTVDAVKAESLTVLVTDQNATPVQGVTVAWAATGGSVSSASVPTGATGLSKVRFTYGTTTGNKTATATVTGLIGSPITITLNATAGAAVTIVKTAGDNGTAPPSSNVNYTVQSRDSHGNAKGGVVIDWAVGTGGGSILPAQNTTAANGNATATRTLGSGLGDQTATATASALSGPPTVTFTTTSAIVTTVDVTNFAFTPSTLTNIPLNTTITWDWGSVATAPHNVTFDNVVGAPTDIPDRTTGTASKQFTTAGTFPYHCTNHPSMTGSITVIP